MLYCNKYQWTNKLSLLSQGDEESPYIWFKMGINATQRKNDITTMNIDQKTIDLYENKKRLIHYDKMKNILQETVVKNM